MYAVCIERRIIKFISISIYNRFITAMNMPLNASHVMYALKCLHAGWKSKQKQNRKY